VHVSGRFNPHVIDPVGRLLRVAASCPSRRAQRDPVVADDVRAEVRQERLTAADLRREVLRLRGELGGLRRAVAAASSRPSHSRDMDSFDAAACPRAVTPPTTRKSYAADPVGYVVPRAVEAAASAPAPDVVNQFRVTNLGTLLDVWA
jgi:hypothetical protein